MVLKINCIHNDQGAWCKNKQIKRSLFGIGARVCVEHEGIKCSFINPYPRPPAPPPKRIIRHV